MNTLLIYLSGSLTIIWGISHLFPTRSVVRSFGDISRDNQRIITMEWIIEGITLIFIGILTIGITFTDPEAVTAKFVYGLVVVMLISLAVVSLFTGFKVNFLPYKLCPLIFTTSAVLILAAMIL